MTASRTGRLAGHALPGPVGAPHLLEIVEAADLGTEHVDDHVAGVDQHPVAGGQPLDARRPETPLLEDLEHALGDRADMAVEAAKYPLHAEKVGSVQDPLWRRVNAARLRM